MRSFRRARIRSQLAPAPARPSMNDLAAELAEHHDKAQLLSMAADMGAPASLKRANKLAVASWILEAQL